MKRYFLTSPDGQQHTEMLEGYEEDRDRFMMRGWTLDTVDQPVKLRNDKTAPMEAGDAPDPDGEQAIEKPQANSIADFLRGDRK